MIPEVQRQLRLEDELRRSYTATLLLKPGRTSLRHAGNRVAAVELRVHQSSTVRTVGAFNVPAGCDAIDRFCLSITQDRVWATQDTENTRLRR